MEGLKYRKAYDIVDDGRIVGFVEKHGHGGLHERSRYRAWLSGGGGCEEFLFEQPTIKQVRYHANARGYIVRKCEGLEQHTRWA